MAAETLRLRKLGSSLTQVISLGTSECCDGVGVGGQTTSHIIYSEKGKISEG